MPGGSFSVSRLGTWGVTERGEKLDYQAALRRLLTLTDYERMSAAGAGQPQTGLARMFAFLERLDNPHTCVPAVHIAGTKGKGSTAVLCASALSAQGYSVGLYTSPHLHSFRERIQVDGKPLTEEEFASLVEELWPVAEDFKATGQYGGVTLFEMLTAMAFWHFRRRELDFQVLEVGLGGRLDATNVVKPEVCVITSLSLDHTSILGDTLEQITREKAGIIKEGACVVSAPQPPAARQVLKEVCEAHATPIIELDKNLSWTRGEASLEGQSFRVKGRLGSYDLWVPLMGDHQLENAAVAVAVLEALRERGVEVTPEALARGFSRVEWPCRMEVLRRRPLVVADGAHNPYSAGRLRQAVLSYIPARRVILVCGVSIGHHIRMVTELAPLSSLAVATRSRHPRSMEASAVADAFRKHGLATWQTENVRDAVVQALEVATARDLILVTGSLFVAAEAREFLKGIVGEVYPEFQYGLSSAEPASQVSHG